MLNLSAQVPTTGIGITRVYNISQPGRVPVSFRNFFECIACIDIISCRIRYDNLPARCRKSHKDWGCGDGGYVCAVYPVIPFPSCKGTSLKTDIPGIWIFGINGYTHYKKDEEKTDAGSYSFQTEKKIVWYNVGISIQGNLLFKKIKDLLIERGYWDPDQIILNEQSHDKRMMIKAVKNTPNS